jgi:hypothetical protein
MALLLGTRGAVDGYHIRFLDFSTAKFMVDEIIKVEAKRAQEQRRK